MMLNDDANKMFIVYTKMKMEEIREIASDKGWEHENAAEKIALMHSELSEALEYLRDPGKGMSDHIPEFYGVEEELADCIIRILDFAEAWGLRVPGALVAKVKFNRTREHKHGGKRF